MAKELGSVALIFESFALGILDILTLFFVCVSVFSSNTPSTSVVGLERPFKLMRDAIKFEQMIDVSV